MSDDRQQNEDQEEGEGPSLPPLPPVVQPPLAPISFPQDEFPIPGKKRKRGRPKKNGGGSSGGGSSISRLRKVVQERGVKKHCLRSTAGVTEAILSAVNNCTDPEQASWAIPDDVKARIVGMVECGMLSLGKIRRQIGIPKHIVMHWLGPEIEKRLFERRQMFRLQMMARLNKIMEQILDEVPDRIEEAPLQVLVNCFATIFDKARLIEGAPSQIIENRGIEERIVSIQQNYASAIKVAMEIEDLAPPPVPAQVEIQPPKKKFSMWPEEQPPLLPPAE